MQTHCVGLSGPKLVEPKFSVSKFVSDFETARGVNQSKTFALSVLCLDSCKEFRKKTINHVPQLRFYLMPCCHVR
jgi:hypothetical protein